VASLTAGKTFLTENGGYLGGEEAAACRAVCGAYARYCWGKRSKGPVKISAHAQHSPHVRKTGPEKEQKLQRPCSGARGHRNQPRFGNGLCRFMGPRPAISTRAPRSNHQTRARGGTFLKNLGAVPPGRLRSPSALQDCVSHSVRPRPQTGEGLLVLETGVLRK